MRSYKSCPLSMDRDVRDHHLPKTTTTPSSRDNQKRMTAILALLPAALLASSSSSPPPVAAFAGIRTSPRTGAARMGVHETSRKITRIDVSDDDAPASSRLRFHLFSGVRRRRRRPSPLVRSLGRNTDDATEKSDGDSEEDPSWNDRREGMADAFAALDSLTAEDFEDFRSVAGAAGRGAVGGDMEKSAKLYVEMQAELSKLGEEGLYDDIWGDLTGVDDGNASSVSDGGKRNYYDVEEEDDTGLGRALDAAALLDGPPAASVSTTRDDDDASSPVLNDADGIGAPTDDSTPLTTANVTKDIIAQEIEPSLSMEDFMSRAVQEAVTEIASTTSLEGGGKDSSSKAKGAEDIARAAEQLLEDEELRKEIESIFDKAGERLRLEVEAMKKEQVSDFSQLFPFLL